MRKRIQIGVTLCSLILGLLAVRVIQAEAPHDVDLGVRLYGGGIEEEFQRTRLVGTEFEGRFIHDWKSLKGVLRAGARMESGESRGEFIDEYNPKQVPRLNEASLTWLPTDVLWLKAGALPQEELRSPLLFYVNQTFPAVTQSFRLPMNSFYLQLFGEQAVPIGPTTTTRPLPDNGTPLLFLERVAFGYDEPTALAAEARVSHFAFDRLSPSTAHMSRFYGNSVLGLGEGSSDFAHGFQGFEFTTEVTVKALRDFQPRLLGSYVVNALAPAGDNRASLLGFESDIHIARGYLVTPAMWLFDVSGDAMPAYFTNSEWGHNNRRGFGGGIRVNFEAAKVETGLRLTRSWEKVPNPYQADWSSFLVFLRTEYDIL